VRLAGKQQELLERITKVPIGNRGSGSCLAGYLLEVSSRLLQLIQIGKQREMVKRAVTFKLL
jgi:hypothetical protein